MNNTLYLNNNITPINSLIVKEISSPKYYINSYCNQISSYYDNFYFFGTILYILSGIFNFLDKKLKIEYPIFYKIIKFSDFKKYFKSNSYKTYKKYFVIDEKIRPFKSVSNILIMAVHFRMIQLFLMQIM